MRLKLYGCFIFLISLLSLGAFAQNAAEYRVLQTTSGDTLYLDFEIRRTTTFPYQLAGYNIVFRIDSSVVDTGNYVLVNQGAFGSVPNVFRPLSVIHLADNLYQITVFKENSAGSTVALSDNFTKAGKLAFVVKKCARTSIAFTTTPPYTAIAALINNNVVNVPETAVRPDSVNLRAGTNAILNASKDTVCQGGRVNLTVSPAAGYSQFTLLSRSANGTFVQIRPAQASPVFSNVTVSSNSEFAVRFQAGNSAGCIDTTPVVKVAVAAPPSALTITSPPPPVCLNTRHTFTSDINNPGNKITWRLVPPTQARFIGDSTGNGLSSVTVELRGTNPYSVNLVVADSNKFGCSSKPDTVTITPIKCNLTAYFRINNSDTLKTVCLNNQLTFNDSSFAAGSAIVKWQWNFGAAANPDSVSFNSSQPVSVNFNTVGIVNATLTVTDDKNAKSTFTKSIRVNPVLNTAPSPVCGNSGCNEVSFNWQPVNGAVSYQVSYKKGRSNTYPPFTGVGSANSFTVTNTSPGMNGTLEFSNSRNDTVFFMVRAVGACGSTTSTEVFCRPAFCSVTGNCVLPSVTLSASPATGCLGSNVKITAVSNPPAFYNLPAYDSVRFVWNNGPFDTAHTYNVRINTPDFQKVDLLVINKDTAFPDCYSIKSITIPVNKTLTTKPDLGIRGLQCDRATFVWKPVDGVLKYQIRYDAKCLPFQDWTDVALGGKAEFYEVNGLTNNCQINFQVRAVGSCNTTQSDTLLSPPSCQCYTGHIASSGKTICAFDTATMSVTGVQAKNWLISWHNLTTGERTAPARDSVYRYVPVEASQFYRVNYTIYDLSRPDSCKATGTIVDTTRPGENSEWVVKPEFCIRDVLTTLEGKSGPGNSFFGPGVQKINDRYYFNASLAGLGTHTITFNACGNTSPQTVTVVDAPCVSSVVNGSQFTNPNDLYTACDGTIYITDDNGIWKHSPGNASGLPELLVRSTTYGNINGNIKTARFGEPKGIVLDESTNNELYFADYTNHMIKKITFDKQRIDSVAGYQYGQSDRPDVASPVAPLSAARFISPLGLAIHPNMDTIYVSDETNRNIKAFTFKGALPFIKLVAGNKGGGNNPGRGKQVNISPLRIAADSLGISFTDFDNYIGRYEVKNDSVREVTRNNFGYADGFPGQYRVRNIEGVTPQIGEWVYFTDSRNYSLRRINVNTGFMETVAGSPPQEGRSDVPLGATGPAFKARFSIPTALAFNIKGYIDILETGAGANVKGVKRYFIPRWGVGTWDNFDSLYVASCDSDTLTPNTSAGTLRVIKGNPNALNGLVFAPKDTGTYLLGYRVKVGPCDTTFFKTVLVRPQPVPALENDTTCGPGALLFAATKRDTTLRYKWFGPDIRNLALPVNDTSRTITITQSGKYWVEIYFGKRRKCMKIDSASIKIIKGALGKISTVPATTPDQTTVCYGSKVTLSMDEESAASPRFLSFLWSTGDTTKTISASGTANYTVVAKDILGCDVTARYRVIQEPMPQLCIKATDVSTGKNLGWGTYTVSTFAGTAGLKGSVNGTGAAARFDSPYGLAIFNDTLYVSDNNHIIRKVSLRNGQVSDFLGLRTESAMADSVGAAAVRFMFPKGIQFDKAGNLYVADSGAHTISKYVRAPDRYYILAGSGSAGNVDSLRKNALLNTPLSLALDPAGNIYFADSKNNAVKTFNSEGKVRTFPGASFSRPSGLSVRFDGSIMVAEPVSHIIRQIAPDSIITVAAGAQGVSGSTSPVPRVSVPGSVARLNSPAAVSSDIFGNTFMTDAGNHLIRLLDTKGNMITLAGVQGVSGNRNGAGDTATFDGLAGIAVDPETQHVYVADRANHTIRKLNKNKTVYICQGSGFSLSDSCTAGSQLTWKKIESNGTIRDIFTFPRVDTGTYIGIKQVNTTTGCVQTTTDTVRIKFHPKDTTFYITNTGVENVCGGGTFTVSATPGYPQYFWYTRQNNIVVSRGVTTTNTFRFTFPDSAGIYRLYVAVRNSRTGCIDSLNNSYKVFVVKKRAVANFTDSLACLGNITRFYPVGSDTSNSLYSWDFGVTNLTDDTSLKVVGSYLYPAIDNYAVRLIVQENTGFSCPDTIVKTIRIGGLPPLTLSLNNGSQDTLSFCGTSSATVNLRANFTPDANTVPPYKHLWTQILPDGGLVPSETPLTTANPTLPGTLATRLFGYAVRVRDSKGCESNKDSAFVRLSRNPQFRVDASDDTVCMSQKIVLTAIDSTGGNASDYTYNWTINGRPIPGDSTVPTLEISEVIPGRYILTVKNRITKCTSTVTSPLITVVGFTAGFGNINPPVPCSDPDYDTISVVLQGNPVMPIQYLWTDSLTGGVPHGVDDPSSGIIRIYRDSTRVLRLVTRDAGGCEDTSFVRVQGTNRKIPKFSIVQVPDSAICRGQAVTLTAYDSLQVQPPAADYTFAWDSASVSLTRFTGSQLVTSPNVSTSYRLTVTDNNNGCRLTTSPTMVAVQGFDLVIPPVPDPAPCSPTTFADLKPEFDGTPVTPYQEVRWTDSSGGSAPSLTDPSSLSTRSFRDSTRIYKLYLRDAKGCFDSAYVKVQGSSTVKPAFSLLLAPNDTICRGQNITLTPYDSSASPVNQFTYAWDSSGVVLGNDSSVLMNKPLVNTSYTLRVTSINSGCTATVSGPLVYVSGFDVSIDPVSPPVPCSDPDPVPLRGNISAGVIQPVSVLWTDSATGKIPPSIDRPTELNVMSFRDSTRTYQLSVTDAAGCVSQALVKVQGTSKTVPRFSITLSDPGPVCRGAEVIFTPHDLSNTPGRLQDYTYSWDSSGISVNNDNNIPYLVKSPRNSVQYRLKVTSRNSGCDTTLLAPNLVVNGFDVNLQLVDQLMPCARPDSARVVAEVTTQAVTRLVWTNLATGSTPTTLYPLDNDSVKVFRDVTRKYGLAITDTNGCTAADTLTVRANTLIPPSFSIVTGRDTGVCVGGNTPVGIAVTRGTAPFTFIWKDSTGATLTDIDQSDPLNPRIPAFADFVKKKYYVTMTDAEGCFVAGPDSLSLTLYDMSVSIEGTTNKLCRTLDEMAPATDYVVNTENRNTSGSTVAVPVWKHLNTGQEMNVGRELGNVSLPGTYQVEVTNYTTTCVRSATVNIAVVNKPEFPSVSILSEGNFCTNAPLNVIAVFPNRNISSVNDSISYSWTKTGGLNTFTSFDSLARYVPAVNDTGNITFKVVASNRCGSDSAELTPAPLKLGPVSKLIVNTSEARTNQEVVFTNATQHSDSVNLFSLEEVAGNIVWGPGNGQMFQQVYTREGTFRAQVFTVNKNGCTSTDTVLVVVTDKQNLFIPNVFSPNASQQDNKTFRVFGQNLSTQGFSITLYDRWGHMVYQTTDLNKAMTTGWDGKENGIDAQLGVYTYVVTGSFNDGKAFERTGTVTLLR